MYAINLELLRSRRVFCHNNDIFRESKWVFFTCHIAICQCYGVVGARLGGFGGIGEGFDGGYGTEEVINDAGRPASTISTCAYLPSLYTVNVILLPGDLFCSRYETRSSNRVIFFPSTDVIISPP